MSSTTSNPRHFRRLPEFYPPPGQGRAGKCTRCRERALVRLPSHHANFCPDCFDRFFIRAVEKAVKKLELDSDRPIGVAVSGGKDSLALWDVLRRLGFDALGLHLDLGIGEFSEASLAAVDNFAASRGLEYRTARLVDEFGHTIHELDRRLPRDTCSVCGQLKRIFLNKMAVDHHRSILATGHNLDDEAGRLLGNLLRRRTRYLEKFHPRLHAAHPKQADRVKPLYRLDEFEITAYVRVHDIRPDAGPGCPFNRGATSRFHKEALELLEDRMPGTKRNFMFGYLKQQNQPLSEDVFQACRRCGQPTSVDLCAACRLKERLDQTPDRRKTQNID
jgi:uncharacterized protein (TIGR00269 family)